MTQSFVILVNPRAGAGASLEKLPHLERSFREQGALFEVRHTEGPNDATVQVRRIIREGQHAGVAVVGGDGTLNEAVNGFFDENGAQIETGIWLGILPCGTGGDFRKTVSVKEDPATMATQLMWAVPRRVDVGWLTFTAHDGTQASRAFFNIASFGLGGLVDQLVNDGPKWVGGRAAFFLGTMRALTQYKNRRIRVRIDDGPTRETEVLNMAVANGQYFGGGMHIAPNAAIDDGLFDVVGLEGLSRLSATLITPHVYRGTLLGRTGVTYSRAKKVVAETLDSHKVLLDVDGEAPGSLPATFEVRPRAIWLKA